MLSLRRVIAHRGVRVALGLYLPFWLSTATWGNHDVNRRFDQEFGIGQEGCFGVDTKEVETVRIGTLYVRDLSDPRNEALIPENGLFRYRSHGVAVAPFVVVDEIGTVTACLAGIGARRLNLWFPGYTRWWPIRVYWLV